MSVFERVAAIGVVPVIALDDARHALPLADALAEGGLRVIEVTFRTSAAVDTIRQIAQHRAEMLVGAGTVLNEAQAAAAKAAGAMFALSPGIDRQVLDLDAIRSANRVARGLQTGQVLSRHGCRWLDHAKEHRRTLSEHGIGFNPTGGVTRDNLTDWLGYAPVRAVGGIWIAASADIAAENWDKIRSNAAEAADLVRKTRS